MITRVKNEVGHSTIYFEYVEEYPKDSNELDTENDTNFQQDQSNTSLENNASTFEKRKADLCSNLEVLAKQCQNLKQNTQFVDEIHEKVVDLILYIHHFQEENNDLAKRPKRSPQKRKSTTSLSSNYELLPKR